MTVDRGEFTPEQFAEQLAQLRELAEQATTDDEVRKVTSKIAQISRRYRIANGIGLPATPVDQALEVNPRFVRRPHVDYLSDRIANAVRDVERGISRRLVVDLPPRAGKSFLTSLYTPLWLLRKHPDWKLASVSYDATLTREWASKVRMQIEDNPALGVALLPDAGAAGRWETLEGGGMFTTSIGGDFTGRGAKVLVVDDPIKDYLAAHNERHRDYLWNWWQSVAQTRLEAPFLVIVVMTRWHEDDLVGRILSREHPGNPDDWEQIVLPAIANTSLDPIGRRPGEPLYSPLLPMDRVTAINHWASLKEAVGPYSWASMYQQEPAPSKGAIYDIGWWRYWTTNPAHASKLVEPETGEYVIDPVTGLSVNDPNGVVVYVDPGQLPRAHWLDSWDMSFKGEDNSDWVVGQRWVHSDPYALLVGQVRGRWTFTETLERVKNWSQRIALPGSPYGERARTILVEDKANGPAIIDVLKDEIAGLRATSPKASKESRARARTPKISRGEVLLPYPDDPGNEWVRELVSEARNFPHGRNDDQVDAMNQALGFFEGDTVGWGGITVPNVLMPGGTHRYGPLAQRANLGPSSAVASLNQRIDRSMGQLGQTDLGRRRAT